MKKIFKIIIITAIALAALWGIASYGTRNNAPDSDQNVQKIPDANATGELKTIAAESGLAFSEPKEIKFFWFAKNKGDKSPAAAAVFGNSMTVGAVNAEEIAVIKNKFTEKGFGVDQTNSFSGYNAALAGHKKDSTVCFIETAKNLLNYDYNLLNQDTAASWDIRIFCGRLDPKARFISGGIASDRVIDFETCHKALYPLINALPRQCITPTKIYFDPETCKTPTGETMGIQEAVNIEERSECAVQASMKNRHFCNNETGSWEIDLLMAKPGCDPTCVIDIIKKTAKIDYRCPAANQQ